MKISLFQPSHIGKVILIVLLFISQKSFTQDLRFTSGMEYYKGGKYNLALEEFNGALQNPARLSREVLPQAYFFRALTEVRLYNNAIISGGSDTTADNRSYLLDAYNDYKSALLNDDGNWWKKIDTELKNLTPYLLRIGLEALNNSNDLKGKGKVFQGEAEVAEEFLSAAKDIDETYLVNDLLGQAEMNLKKYPAALSDFARSEDLYRSKPPDIPDFLIGYVLFRMAEIQYKEKGDVTRALNDIQRGKELVQKEYDRLRKMQAEKNSGELKEAENKYIGVYKDLTDMEIQLLMQSPEKYQQAVSLFENQIRNNPNDPDLYIGYASMLEKTDPDKSLEMYKKALQLDSNNITALFNAGAMLYNKAREYYEQSGQEKNSDKFKILMDEALDDFGRAKPYFEKYIALSPDSSEALEALKSIAMVLDDQSSYTKYKQMLDQIKANK